MSRFSRIGTFLLIAWLSFWGPFAFATSITVTSGGNQTVLVNKPSEDVTFKVVNDLGNPTTTGTKVNFKMVDALGQPVTGGLSTTVDTTDSKGLVSTRMKATSKKGTYTITATLANNGAISVSTIIQVTEALPTLPTLEGGSSVDGSGVFSSSTAIFSGGVAVNGGEFKSPAILKLSDTVEVKGIVKVESGHVGKVADLVVVAGAKALPPDDVVEGFYMLNEKGQVENWDVNIAALVAFKKGVTLSATQIVDMYKGKFIATGSLRIWFGYRLADGTVVFNAAKTLDVKINP
ncbi:MAG: hypothetical protein BWK79_09670 [Beggiatoa sp. IS2]|nr:MAG: hypothetical protein BWK79_09670 [Beggiatoa sp. IS2]